MTLSMPHAPQEGNRSSDLLVMAAWFGIVTGLVEGTAFTALQKFEWLTWNINLDAVTYEIIWISQVFDLALFGAAGIGLAIAARLLPRVPMLRIGVFLFGFAMFLDWLLLSGRIATIGAATLAAGLAAALVRWFENHREAALGFWRGSLPWAFGIVLLALAGIEGNEWLRERRALASLPPAAPDAPNVLVIVVDTLRADHLSTYGYPRPTSPNFDRLAREGTLFERAFSTSSWTLPSHASLLTGRYPHEHGAERESYDGRFPSIAGVLQARGYRTAAVSANLIFFTEKRGFGEGFIRFDDFFHSVADRAVRTVYGRKLHRWVMHKLGNQDLPARRWADSVNRAALGWIDLDPKKPFFAFLNYMDTHDPYLPPQPYRSRFSKLTNPGGRINEFEGQRSPQLTPEQLQSEIDAYDGAISYVDEQIGRLLGELDRRGLKENTIVIFTSDHGESFGEHGIFTHSTALYRQLIHVPLIVRWPGRVPAGMRIAVPVSNGGLPATLVEILGMEPAATFAGRSLVTLWKNPGTYPDWPDPLAEIAQLPFPSMKKFPIYQGGIKSLVGREWQYIEHEKFGAELYRWENDPGQVNDVAKTPQGQAVAAEFAARMKTFLHGGAASSSIGREESR
ncbi:MAG: sulfatase [Acidobacteria bacterium]|nr:sulfatase [Acidobacteriota bacterium]